MKYLKKTKKILLNSLFIFVTLLDKTSLYAVNEIKKTDVIHYYEQSGNYAHALKAARTLYEQSLQMGLHQETATLSETIAKLENSLLNLGSSMLLFDEYHQPRVKLLQLLKLVGMETSCASKYTLTQINDWAQKYLLRKGERWEQQTTRFEGLKPQIMPLLKELGFVEPTNPHFNTYQGAVIHGALLPRVRLRIHYLIQQWNKGIRFTHLYFLSGARPLEPQYENKTTLMHDNGSLLTIRNEWQEPVELPKTECEMMQLVWEQSEVPEEMRSQLQVYFINAPMKKDLINKKLLRPNTDDTVEEWLKTSPPYGPYLAVTNAPYINRQDLVIRILSPNEYTFDTVGPGAGEQEKMIIFLDELARLIFQIKELSIKSL